MTCEMTSTEQEVIRYQKLYRQVLLERNQFKQQCNQAIRQWDQALRERNDYRDALQKVQRQHEDAMKEVNQSMTARMKAGQDVKRIEEERNAAMQEYKLVMSERDSVHDEIEKLQEKVDGYESKIGQMEKKDKDREAERQRLQFQVEVLKRGRDRAETEMDKLREKLEKQKQAAASSASTSTSTSSPSKSGAHYEAVLDLGPTSSAPSGRGHGLTLELGVYVAAVEDKSVASELGSIAIGDRVLKINGHALDRMKDVSGAAKMLNELRNRSGCDEEKKKEKSEETKLVLILAAGSKGERADLKAKREAMVAAEKEEESADKAAVPTDQQTDETSEAVTAAAKTAPPTTTSSKVKIASSSSPPSSAAPATMGEKASSSDHKGQELKAREDEKRGSDPERGEAENAADAAADASRQKEAAGGSGGGGSSSAGSGGGGIGVGGACGGSGPDTGASAAAGAGGQKGKKKKKQRSPRAKDAQSTQQQQQQAKPATNVDAIASAAAAGGGTWPRSRGGPVIEQSTGTILHPQKIKKERLPLTELMENKGGKTATTNSGGVQMRSSAGDPRGGSTTLGRQSKHQRPATTFVLTNPLESGSAQKEDSNAQEASANDGKAKGRDMVGGGSGESSPRLVSPPPPMHALSSGGQSAYAALKAMNAHDFRMTSGNTAAHLIKPDGKMGFQSYFSTTTASRSTASSTAPPTSRGGGATKYGDDREEYPPPPPYSTLQFDPPTVSSSRGIVGSGSHTPPSGHILVSTELSLMGAGSSSNRPPLLLAGNTFLSSDQVHPGSLTSSMVTPSGSKCGHYSHMNFSSYTTPTAAPAPVTSSAHQDYTGGTLGRRSRRRPDPSDDDDDDVGLGFVPASVLSHVHHRRRHGNRKSGGTGGGTGGERGAGPVGGGTFPRKRRDRDGSRNSPQPGGTLPNVGRMRGSKDHHVKSGGGRSRRHHSTSSGTDRAATAGGGGGGDGRDRSSKRNGVRSTSRTVREQQIRSTRRDSSDSTDYDDCPSSKKYYSASGGETLSRRRNSRDYLKKSSASKDSPKMKEGKKKRDRSSKSGGDGGGTGSGSPRTKNDEQDLSTRSKSPSPRHAKDKAAAPDQVKGLDSDDQPPPLPPKRASGGADHGCSHNDQCQMSDPNCYLRHRQLYNREELDFTSSRLQSESNKRRFMEEEIHRRQEQRGHEQQQELQDRLARELTTTFKMTAGKRLTAKARELSKSQGDGIDDSSATAGERRHKSASRENIYDEASTAYLPSSAPVATAATMPFTFTGEKPAPPSPAPPDNMLPVVSQRMIDPPDLFNTRSRDSKTITSSPQYRVSSTGMDRRFTYPDHQQDVPRSQHQESSSRRISSAPVTNPPPSRHHHSGSGGHHHAHYGGHHSVVSSLGPPTVSSVAATMSSTAVTGSSHHHGSSSHHHVPRSHRSKRIRNRSLEMVLDDRSCCHPAALVMSSGSGGGGSGSGGNGSGGRSSMSYSRSLERPKHRKSENSSTLMYYKPL